MPLEISTPSPTIVIATIDRGKANALDLDLVRELRHVVASLGATQGLVLTGAGEMFCGGLDTATVAAGDVTAHALLDAMGALLYEILESPRAIVVAADGHGIAAGAMMMLCADYTVVADRRARYGFAEVPNGLPLPAAIVQLIASRVTPAMTLRLAAHGELVDATTAASIGLASEVVDREELMTVAVTHAERLAALPPDVYRETKLRVNSALTSSMRSAST